MRTLIYLCLLLAAITLKAQEDWKPAAEAAILQHRTSPVSIQVVDANGNAVSDATVRLRMRESDFRWGTTMNIDEVTELQQAGFPIGSNHPYYNHFRYFNSVTPENAGKWKAWLRPSTRETYLAMTDWFSAQGIANRGHTTIWPSIRRWDAVPESVTQAQAEVVNGTAVRSREQVVRDSIRSHIQEQLPILAEHGVYELDLINELIHEADISDMLLGLPAADRPAEHAQWHKWAREASEEVELIVNEYDLWQSGNDFHRTFVDYVRKMIALGAPVDGVGMQGHFFGPMPDFPSLERRLNEVAVLGLPMAVTEFDMNGESYADMERALYAAFAEPLLRGFTLWGAWDGRQWRDNAAVFRQDWSLKPSGRAYFDLVRDRWRTDTTVTAAQLQVAAFRGTYDVYVDYQGRTLVQQFTLDSSGRELTIDVSATTMATPTANLEIAGAEDGVVYPNEPLQLQLESSDSIERVTYYLNGLILAVLEDGTSAYPLQFDTPGLRQITAELEFSSGYSLTLAAPALEISDANSNPVIVSIFPATGTTVLQRDSLEVYITARDANAEDSLTAYLYDESGKVLAEGPLPGRFYLSDLPIGPNRLTVRVTDDKFGIAEQDFQLNVVTPGAEIVSATRPQEADDDVEQTSSGSIDVEGDLDLGEKLTAIRFATVALPPGALIDSAFVQFTNQKDDQAGPVTLRLQVEATTSAGTLTAEANGLTVRKRSTALVDWSVPDWPSAGERARAQRSPDLTPLLEELTALTGWSDASPVVLLIDHVAGESKRSAFSVDQAADEAAALRIYYRTDQEFNAPPPPAGFSFTADDPTGGRLAWETPNGPEILGYKLFLDGEEVETVLTNRGYTLVGLTEGQTYTVVAQTIGGFAILSDRSVPFTFTAGQTTAVRLAATDISGLAIFPNPLRDRLTIRHQTPPQTIRLYTVNGQLLTQRAGTGRETVFNLTGLAPGSYLLELRYADERVYTQVILKQR